VKVGRRLGTLLLLSLALVAITSCSSGAPAPSPSATVPTSEPSASPTVHSTPLARNELALYALLQKALRSANPSWSAKVLDAHIRRVTGAPYSMIVAPYDPTAEFETARFWRTVVATYGTDASWTTEFEERIQKSRGKPLHVSEESIAWAEPFLFCGHAVEVRGRDGYVLIAVGPL